MALPLRLTFAIVVMAALSASGQLSGVFQAEHEKNEGVLMVWDYHPERDSVVANIAGAVQNSGKVWIIYYPGTAPMDTAEIRQYLLSHDVGYHNVLFVPGWTETLWIRDFGPFTGYGDFGDGLQRYMLDAGYSAYGRPMDDSIPSQLAGYWEMPAADLPLELEGGNILLDGLKYGFASSRLLEQNPEYSEQDLTAILEDYFHTNEFILLEELTQTGGGIWSHVDMYMKIVDAETIMVSKYPDHIPDFDLIEAQVAFLSELNTYFGAPFEIIRIPAPPNADGAFPDEQNDEMRTYTNSLTMNNVVVVPSYGLPYYDSVAKSVYEQAMPGYTIEMVDSQNLTPLYGAIHCITKEVPQEHMLRIIHKKVTGMQPYSENFNIYSLCQNETEVDSLFLYYRHKGETDYIKTEIQQVCPQNFGVIPGCQPQDTIEYYIEAKTAQSDVQAPLSAPDGYYRFWFDPATASPPIHQARFKVYPNPATTHFVITFPGNLEADLLINRLDGTQMLKKTVENGDMVTLKQAFSKGVYLISLKREGSRPETRKLIIK